MPPTKNKPIISEEAEASLRRLADSRDFQEQFASPWQEMAAKALQDAVTEAKKPAAARCPQAVVDLIREYSFFTAQHDAVYGTLNDLATIRATKAATVAKKEEAQNTVLPTPEENG